MSSQWQGKEWMDIGPMPSGQSDHVVATPHGVSLGVRVWPSATGRHSTSPSPWILWLHGGSTCVGSPYSFPPWVVKEFTERNCVVVSAGYRLTPQVGLEDQLADVRAAFRWCRENLNIIFGEGSVDVDTWATGGESAGARLATLVALQVQPPPKVVLDIYGHTTYFPQHVLDPLPSTQIHWDNPRFSLADVTEAVGLRDPSRALVHVPYLSLSEAQLQQRWSFPEFQYTDQVDLQRAIMTYYALSKSKNFHALRLHECDTSEARAERIAKFSLLDILKNAPTYPATVIMQGLADTIVDPQMSFDLEHQLKSMQVPVLPLYEEHAPHGFDFVYTHPNVEGYDRIVVPAVEFTMEHLKGVAPGALP